MRPVEPHSGNMSDAELLRDAASQARTLALDLHEQAQRGKTVYAEDGFKEALSMLDEVVNALNSEATKAEENATEDAHGELADRAYDNAKDY